MKTLRLIPLVVALAACSSVNIPVSPYRIDVQQGNALEQEAVDKLKVGMTSSQVRFLLGTPLLVDPFRNNRWDYVYNYRKAGKLTEKRRLALFFEGDVLARIDAEGFAPKAPPTEQGKVLAVKAEEKPVMTEASIAIPAAVSPAATTLAVATPEPVKVVPAAPIAAPPSAPSVQAPVAEPPATKVAAEIAKPAVAAVSEVPQAAAAKSELAERSLNETSIVPPMTPSAPGVARKPVQVAVSEKPPESMALQPETNVAAVVPEVTPAFPDMPGKAGSTEDHVMAALNSWANAWKSRDEDAYLAAYAANFQPPGGLTRAEWEKRRRLLLGHSRNIDLKIDGHAFEAVTEDRAQVSFRQYYRSDSYQDAVIKLIKFVRVDNLWLIEEEKVLAPIKVKK